MKAVWKHRVISLAINNPASCQLFENLTTTIVGAKIRQFLRMSNMVAKTFWTTDIIYGSLSLLFTFCTADKESSTANEVEVLAISCVSFSFDSVRYS